MNEQRDHSIWFTFSSLLFMPIVFCGLAFVIGMEVGDGGFKRFSNSLLTSYTLTSIFLLLTLFVYGDTRKRPIAPLIGMLVASGLGVLITFMMLSQGEMLMEDNGSVRAQALSNIIRFSTTLLAVIVSGLLVGGLVFSSLMQNSDHSSIGEEE